MLLNNWRLRVLGDVIVVSGVRHDGSSFSANVLSTFDLEWYEEHYRVSVVDDDGVYDGTIDLGIPNREWARQVDMETLLGWSELLRSLDNGTSDIDDDSTKHVRTVHTGIHAMLKLAEIWCGAIAKEAACSRL